MSSLTNLELALGIALILTTYLAIRPHLWAPEPDLTPIILPPTGRAKD